MKIKPKKLMTLLVSAMLTVSSLSLSNFSALAEESTTTAETNVSDSAVTTTGVVGSFFSDEMKKSEEEKNKGQNQNYNINNVEYDAERGLIDIDYITKTNSTVFVGFYNDEGTELISSMTKNVQADEKGHLQLSVVDTLPEHYLIKVFLVGNHQNALCKAFIYEKCTKVMQEVLSTTTRDYNAEDVINFDDKEDSNFLVVADDAIHIKSTSSYDIYEKTDEKGRYCFNNIKAIAELTENDDIVVVEIPKDLLIFKVSKIEIDGTSAYITPNTDVELKAAFQFININSNESEQKQTTQNEPVQITQPEPTPLPNNMEVLKRYQASPKNFDSEDKHEVSIAKLYTWYITKDGKVHYDPYEEINDKNNYTKENEPFDEAYLAATVHFAPCADVEIYYKSFLSFFSGDVYYNADITIDFGLDILAEFKREVPIAEVLIPIGSIPPKILALYVDPTFVIEVYGKFSTELIIEMHFDKNNGFSAFDPSLDFDLIGTVDIAIKMPVIFAFADKVGEFSFVPRAGIRFTFDKKLATTKEEYKHHDCLGKCSNLKGETYFNLEGAFESILTEEKFEARILEITNPGYVTLNENGMTLGECNNYSYLMKYHVKDQKGNPIKGVKITSDGKQLLDINGKTSIETDKNGYAEFWVPIKEPGDEVAMIKGTAPTGEIGEFCLYTYYTPDLDRAMECNRTIKLKKYETDDKKDTSDEGSISVRSGNSNLISYGNINAENKSLYYEYYKDGSIKFYGSGELSNFIPDGSSDENSRDLTPFLTKATVIGNENLILTSGAFSSDYYKSIDLSRLQIKEIPESVFMNCKKLEELILPSSLEIINGSAFYQNALSHIELPENVKTIGENSFGYTKFEEFVLPEKLEYIGAYAFQYSNVRAINFNNNLTTIAGPCAFANSQIKSVVLPESLKYVGDCAFMNCSNLKKVVINSEFATNDSKDEVSTGCQLFASCPILTTVYLSDNVKTIWPEQFINSYKLKNIRLSNNLKTIKKQAFMSSGIEEITLPESVETIEEEVFSGSALKKITILNPKCSIEKNSIPSTAVIYGYANSTAHKYALANGNSFESLDPETVVTTIAGTTTRTTNTTTTTPTTAENTTTAPVTTVYTYTNAVPDTEYVLIAVKDASAIKTEKTEDGKVLTADEQQLALLSSDNILFFDQQTANEKKEVLFSFVEPKVEKVTYILVGDFGSHEIDRAVSEGKPEVTSENTETFKNEYISETKEEKKEEEFELGDANGDGIIALNDAVLIMQFLANPSKFGPDGSDPNHITEEGLLLADVVGDNDGVTAKDALEIQKFMLGLIKSLPDVG